MIRSTWCNSDICAGTKFRNRKISSDCKRKMEIYVFAKTDVYLQTADCRLIFKKLLIPTAKCRKKEGVEFLHKEIFFCFQLCSPLPDDLRGLCVNVSDKHIWLVFRRQCRHLETGVICLEMKTGATFSGYLCFQCSDKACLHFTKCYLELQ